MSTTTVIVIPPGRHPWPSASTPLQPRSYLTECRRAPAPACARVLIRRAIVAGCALVALGAACSSSGGGSAGTTTTAPATTAPRSHRTTTTAKTPTTTPADPIGALMLGDIFGYTRQSDDVA